MRRGRMMAAVAAALLLAVAVVSAAYAMRDDGDDTEPARQEEASDGSGSGTSFAMCAEGVTDCQDTVVLPEGESADCPPDTACIEPWLMEPPVCPVGVEQEVCEEPLRCVYPLPAVTVPAEGEPADAPTVQVEEDGDVKPAPECAPDPCGDEPAPNVRCLPPDCAISSDGSVSCPAPEPCVVPDDGSTAVCPTVDCEDEESLVHCVPPSCVMGSDGSVTCPPSEPCEPGPAVDCIAPDSGGGAAGGGSAPGGAPVTVPLPPEQ